MFLKSCWWEGFVMIIEFKGQTVLSVQVVQVHSRFHSVMSRSLSWERNSLISTFAHHSLEHSLTHLHIPPFSHSDTNSLTRSLTHTHTYTLLLSQYLTHFITDQPAHYHLKALSNNMRKVHLSKEGGLPLGLRCFIGWGSSRWQLSWDVLLLQVSQFRLIAQQLRQVSS